MDELRRRWMKGFLGVMLVLVDCRSGSGWSRKGPWRRKEVDELLRTNSFPSHPLLPESLSLTPSNDSHSHYWLRPHSSFSFPFLGRLDRDRRRVLPRSEVESSNESLLLPLGGSMSSVVEGWRAERMERDS